MVPTKAVIAVIGKKLIV